MRGGYDYTPIPLSEASCIIAHLFAELALPCSCCNREDNDEIVIQGTAYDGTGAKIIIKGKEVRYYGKQRPAPRFDGSLDLLTGREAGEHNAPSSKEGVSLPHPAPYDRPGHG